MLADVCNILDSKRIPITRNKRLAGPYPYYGANGIQDYVADYIFDDELVLLAEDGGHFEGGRQIAYRVSGKCWVNNHAHVLKAKKNIDTDYLYFALRCYDVTSLTNGATRKKLTQAAMKRILLPLRSINDQLYIVNNLKSAEAQLESARNQLSKLDGLVKSRFVEMFGDPATAEAKHELLAIGNFTDVQTGATPLRREPKYYGGSMPWVKTGEVARNFANGVEESITEVAIKETNCKVFPAGTVLVAMYGQGDTRGKAAILPFEAATNQACAAIMPSSAHNEVFLNVQLQLLYEDMRAKSLGGNQKNLSLGIVKSMEVILPPMEAQQEFAAFASWVDKSRFIAQQQIEKLQMLYDSLAQDYFGD